MPAWPASLPSPERRGLSDTPKDNVLRSPMSTGPAKQRRRCTATGRDLAFTLQLSGAQCGVLDDFYLSTTAGGALAFDFTHPRTQASVSARFAAPPSTSNLAGDRWSVAVTLEILP